MFLMFGQLFILSRVKAKLRLIVLYIRRILYSTLVLSKYIYKLELQCILNNCKHRLVPGSTPSEHEPALPCWRAIDTPDSNGCLSVTRPRYSAGESCAYMEAHTVRHLPRSPPDISHTGYTPHSPTHREGASGPGDISL